jgi:hypothetical protein
MAEASMPPDIFVFQQGSDLLVTDCETLDDAQRTGQWIRVDRGGGQ